jgi:NTP pyrophosphatase (non-canonical NTP hydrolase)
MKDIDKLKKVIARFRDDRDWDKFHSLQNLVSAMSIEVSELAELFLWKDDGEIKKLLVNPDYKQKVKDECADILNYLILISDNVEFDLIEASYHKIENNNNKYPVSKSFGIAKKYNELDDND